MRVAVVIPRYAPIFGGAENQCRQLLRALTRTGDVEVPFVVTKRIRADLKRDECIDAIDVVRLGTPGISRWSEYGFYARTVWLLASRRREFHLIHCHATSVIGFAVAVIGRLINRPVVLKLSSNGELVTGLRDGAAQPTRAGAAVGRLRRVIARYTVRHAHVVALNSEGADELRLAGAVHPHEIVNAVDANRFRPPAREERDAARARLGIAADEFVFLYTGRFVASKGIDTLLAAIDRVEPESSVPGGRQLRFVFVGSGTLQSAAVAIRGGRAVRTFDATADVSPFLAAADAFVFPSRREGTPNAVLEALAAGLPCVLSDIRPHRELSDRNPGARCYFFSCGDPADLAGALARCAAEITGPGASARPSTLNEEYTLDSVTVEYVTLYRTLTQPGAPIAKDCAASPLPRRF